MFFTIFDCLFVEKMKNKVSACLYEIITYFILEILPVTLSDSHLYATLNLFQKPPAILKIVLEFKNK
jgi:hypothetical protein